MRIHNSRYWIDRLALVRHPEGGWFSETYRAAESIPATALPKRFQGPRNFSSGIYFLLERGDFSALHRIAADEMWHFYDGAPLVIEILSQEGEHRSIRLGRNPDNQEQFQAVVPAGCWFGATSSGTFSLVGCTVAPGFDFNDFEMARPADLNARYPEQQSLIRRLTREP